LVNENAYCYLTGNYMGATRKTNLRICDRFDIDNFSKEFVRGKE